MRVAAIVFGLTALVFAQEDSLESPSEQRQGMETRRPVMRPSPAQKEQAASYLALWDKSGREAKGRERLDLAQLRSWAGDSERSLDAMLAMAADGEEDATLRAAARKQYAKTILLHRTNMSATRIAAARKTLTGMANDGEDADDGERAMFWQAITSLARLQGDWKATEEAAWNAIGAKPRMASLYAPHVIAAQTSGVYQMDEYDALRKRIEKTTAEIRENAAITRSGRRNERWAQFVEDSIARTTKFLDLLGKPAPAWKVEHAFHGPSTLAEQKGKIVLVYFWQTRSDEAVRCLATMRDLAKRYKDKQFAIVGVTWHSKRFYSARYELDADVDEDAGKKKQPQKPEQETIAEFLKNHRIAWPTVMIPTADSAVWNLTSVPTTVLIDAQGRVRYITPGPIRRESKIAKEEIPKVIDALLKEPQ